VAISPENFRGRLSALSIADLLEFLRSLNRSGLLTITADGISVGLSLRQGRVIHATSNRGADRLTDLLLRWGMIDPERCARTMDLVAAGQRIGKALVASGALTPRTLVEARRRQVHRIALSVFEWDRGEFSFVEGVEPDPEAILVELEIAQILVEGIRSVSAPHLFRERLSSPAWLYEPIGASDRAVDVALEPHERYVLDLVDGRRDVRSIMALSEFPEDETLRILFLLGCLGHIKRKIPVSSPRDAAAGETVEEMLRCYNQMFEHVHGVLMNDVGPISQDLLERALREMRAQHPVLLRRARVGGDGTLDGDVLKEGLQELDAASRRQALVVALNELLYSELLILRQTLGSERENRALRSLRRIGRRFGLQVGASA
jgi:hypothetical protein